MFSEAHFLGIVDYDRWWMRSKFYLFLSEVLSEIDIMPSWIRRKHGGRKHSDIAIARAHYTRIAVAILDISVICIFSVRARQINASLLPPLEVHNRPLW